MGQNPKTQKPQQMLGFATLCRSARQAQKWRRGELNPYGPPTIVSKTRLSERFGTAFSTHRVTAATPATRRRCLQAGRQK
jgi:hypothetical protein